MPSKEQDVFEQIINEANDFFETLHGGVDSAAGALESHFESVSKTLKDAFRASPWLPDSVKPSLPPPSRPRLPTPSGGYLEASRTWVSEHRAVTAAVVAFVGTGAFIIWKRRRSDRAKRRAKRAKNGGRMEVVVLAGSPHSPLTRSISLELERRGFIIYIPVGSLSEERVIESEAKADIRPLSLDITSASSTEDTIQKFNDLLTSPRKPIPNVPPHRLRLTALILVPGQSPPTNPIASLTPSTWSDTFNTQLLAPFTTVQAFLPLLAQQTSTLLFLTPSITASLTPASHATESVVAGALQQYISTLRKEALGLNVTQFQLGYFDYSHVLADEQQQLVRSQNLSIADADRLSAERIRLVRKEPRGTSMRELHNAVFDAIVRGKGRNSTIFVGQGSRVYHMVGKLVPSGIIGWMMGTGKPPKVEVERKESSPEHSTEWDKVGERSSDDEGYVSPRRR